MGEDRKGGDEELKEEEEEEEEMELTKDKERGQQTMARCCLCTYQDFHSSEGGSVLQRRSHVRVQSSHCLTLSMFKHHLCVGSLGFPQVWELFAHSPLSLWGTRFRLLVGMKYPQCQLFSQHTHTG